MGLFSWISGSTPNATSTPVVDSTSRTFSGDLETVPRNNTRCYTIEGYMECGYFQDALKLGSKVAEAGRASGNSSGEVHVDTNIFSESEFFKSRLAQVRRQVPGSERHRSCPIVYEGCEPSEYRYVGGYDAFVALAAKRHHVKP
ncbi:hypothetical protein BCR44DRAFT_49419 [Catenaria anguillulae PL171]|uniref:Uncharacterized protein n=1 Tax=Catenaria anguillulae PL171 TaxID=765915 RepID=A0A1Y2HMZ3_9FUNG|nr:hypothetical protein BCR44DRAFT_49419 [Catenaria anguillulae PL171]